MEQLDELQEWLLSSPLGHYMLHHERIFYHNIVQRVFGYYALQIGLPQINFLQTSKISSSYTLSHNIKTKLESLPIKTNSIDLIICPHVLEFMPNYDHLLQECYRILIPNGKLIITSFNKYSLLNAFKPEALKLANLISLNTLKQQLNTLNFHIEGGKFLSYRLPLNNQQVLSRLSFMDNIGDRWLPTFANNYAISASKQLASPILIQAKPQRKELKLAPQFSTFNTQTDSNSNLEIIKCKNKK
ncbi:MAG: class I SAM-dependent methyltransferase [Proteobacteria bacterium]|nr:class I SAM-dependent methyltransferase [Pseudomonadota bacterium]